MLLRKPVCKPPHAPVFTSVEHGNDRTFKGLDGQLKTDVKVKLLSVTSWLSLLNTLAFRAMAAVPNTWKSDQNVVENAFLAQGCKSIAAHS